MTAARARLRLPDADGPFIGGTSAFALVPSRQFRLDVVFPPGYWPLRPFCVAWPAGRPQSTTGGDLFLQRLHGGAHRFTPDERRGRLRFEVDAPLWGFQYGIGWYLP